DSVALEGVFASARSRAIVVAYGDMNTAWGREFLETLRAAAPRNLIIVDGSNETQRLTEKVSEYASGHAPLIHQLQAICSQLQAADICKTQLEYTKLQTEARQLLTKV